MIYNKIGFFCYILNDNFLKCYVSHKNKQSECAMSIADSDSGSKKGPKIRCIADSGFRFGLPILAQIVSIFSESEGIMGCLLH